MKQEPVLKQLGVRVRESRENLGWSQEELAARSGLHRTYIGGIERGERNLGLENIVRIADALGTCASGLLKGVAGGE